MGKEKVLLIYPPLDKDRTTPPIKAILIGLAYLGAVLKQAGYEVQIFDGITSTEKELLAKLFEFHPDVVGVSAMFTPYAKDAHRVAHLVKSFFPDMKVIFGGAHASTFPKEVLKDDNVDVVVVGEGEETTCEVIENIHYFKEVKGIAYRDFNGISNDVIIEPRKQIENLDALPFPSWDLLEKDLEIVKEQTKHSKFIMRKPSAHLLTSRGCPKGCYFCSVKLMWGQKWRTRSAKNVVDEIEWLKSKGYREFYFMDDNCSVSRRRMHEICEMIIKNKLNIRLACPTGIAIETLDYKTLKLMKQAGFYRLCFGIETGNQASQEIIGKKVNLARAKRIIAHANRLGFWTSATFILGFPHETMEEINDTIEFAKTSGIDFPVIHLLCPQPKTKVNDIMRAEGLIDDSTDINATYVNGFKTSSFSNDDLHRIVAQAYKSFLLYKLTSPRTYRNLLLKIKSWEDFKYACGLLTIPIGMLKASLLGRKLSVISARQKGELKKV